MSQKKILSELFRIVGQSVDVLSKNCMQLIGMWRRSFPEDAWPVWNLLDKMGDMRLKFLESLKPIYSKEEPKYKLELFTSQCKDKLVNIYIHT